MNADNRRFRAALSFPGEHRAFVEQVAEDLGKSLGRKRVLYDAWYEAEFARLSLDDYLQHLYRNESDLIAVFLCADYERKRWCRLEWRAIKDLITTAREGSIMLFRFDDTSIPGVFLCDGYVDVRDRTPEQIAKLILQRLTGNEEFVLVLSAQLAEVDKPRALAIVEHLRKICNDSSLTLVRVEKGSVRLVIKGSPHSYMKIKKLFKEGSLSDEIQVPVQRIEAALDLTGAFPPSRVARTSFIKQAKLASSRLPHTAEYLVGRENDLAALDTAWLNPKTHVLTIVAWGGVGKTSLVGHWLARIASDDWRGAERVFDWSFYSQGTRKEGAPSAEQFIEAALRFFEDPDPTRGSSWDKGERLAELVSQKRSLLVLDGLEPLQQPPGPLAGQVKDDAIKALLKGLAQRNQGLCVVTTREHLADLAPFRNTTAPVLELQNLSTPVGVDLLKTLGVRGTRTEFRRLVEDVAGHALTLNLLATYLVLAHRGDIRKQSYVRLKEANPQVQGGHAFKVMDAYDKWLVSNGKDGEQQLAALRLLGLFDRPADSGCLSALRKEPPIFGLTETLVGLTVTRWNINLRRLEECGLVRLRQEDSTVGTALTVDAHPLVREYFANRLEEENPDARRLGHARLFEELIAAAPQSCVTVEEMAPLFQALIHGCEAGRLREALFLYRERILGGKEGAARYTLGAFGSQVAALFYFVDVNSRQPASELATEDGAFVLSQLGFCLRSLTRFKEAQGWMQSALETFLGLRNWKSACDCAAILCHLCTTTGELERALSSARQCVALADRSRDPYLRTIMRMTLGNALHYVGRFPAARQAFMEAQKLKPTLRSEESRLRYTLRLFHYHDFLLTEGRLQEVLTGARKAFKVHLPGRQSELNQGLHSVSLGLALLLKAQRGEDANVAEAQEYLDEALVHLRNADREDDLPYALTARADVRRLRGDLDGAEADLEEALLITSRAGMRRLAAHCHLSYARLNLANGKRAEAASSLAEADKLVRAMKYRRLEKEVANVQKLLGAVSRDSKPNTRPA